MKTCNSSVVYGAVDKRKLAEKLYGSADPVNMCFRICVEGVEEWIAAKHSGEMVLLVVDDCEKEIKKTLRASFKRHRNQVWEAESKKYDWTFHDDMSRGGKG